MSSIAAICLIVEHGAEEYFQACILLYNRIIGKHADVLVMPSLTTVRGVGFLNYWTVSNLPLFSIATPMLIVMLWSAYSIFRHSSHTSQAQTTEPLSPDTPRLLRSLAIPQIVLAAMAITNYHVQIINRLSSAYPVWYIWLASQLVASIPIDAKVAKHGRKTSQTWSVASLTRAMILYGLVQGGLFASFLPPA